MEPMEVESVHQVYAFGNGSADQLGTGSAISESRSPSIVPTFNAQKIMQISSGINFSVAITG
jgi:alpha-tubulin suppressor-like RCC1 family protein